MFRLSRCNFILTYIVILLSADSFSQAITGNYQWKNEKYQGTASFDSTLVKKTIYFKGSDSKALETIQYYRIEKNKLYLSDNPFDENFDKKSATVYKIKDLSEKIINLSGSEGDEIYTKSKKQTTFRKFNPGEFYLITNKPACIIENEKISKAGKCLSIFGIDFYKNFQQITEILGKPYNSNLLSDGSQEYRFILIPGDQKSPILSVTFKDDKPIKIELSGSKSSGKITFSGIQLGDYYSFVKSRLGEPAYKKEVTAPGDETWVFSPIPVTIQFRLNKATSISIEPFQLAD